MSLPSQDLELITLLKSLNNMGLKGDPLIVIISVTLFPSGPLAKNSKHLLRKVSISYGEDTPITQTVKSLMGIHVAIENRSTAVQTETKTYATAARSQPTSPAPSAPSAPSGAKSGAKPSTKHKYFRGISIETSFKNIVEKKIGKFIKSNNKINIDSWYIVKHKNKKLMCYYALFHTNDRYSTQIWEAFHNSIVNVVKEVNKESASASASASASGKKWRKVREVPDEGWCVVKH
tara:strand:+ start:81 stop:782 length:702 start_codon:yes stop_codon:yes gene_type:complete